MDQLATAHAAIERLDPNALRALHGRTMLQTQSWSIRAESPSRGPGARPSGPGGARAWTGRRVPGRCKS